MNLRIFNDTFLYITGGICVAVVLVLLLITGKNNQHTTPIIPEQLHKSWKVVAFYQNGKQVVNSPYEDVKFIVNKDGTAQWYTPAKTISTSVYLSNDNSQLILDNGITEPEHFDLMELNTHKLRFGRRNIVDHYSYVMVPVFE